MVDQLTLEVDGQTYQGWTEAHATRSYEQFCPSFDLTYVDRWFGQDPWPILPGAACVLRYGSSTLLTGYVNRGFWRISGNEYNLTASGRGKTQDLVDCSAAHKTKVASKGRKASKGAGKWSQQTMSEIISDLCSPFELDVVVSGANNVKFKRFALNIGESYYEAIDRMCKLCGLLATSDEFGALVILSTDFPTRYVAMPVKDAIDRTLEISDQNRFSEYLLLSQTGGDSEFSGANISGQDFVATDTAITRYRPLIITGNAPGHKKELQAQAQYELNIRAGQSASLIYTVPGILAPDGDPWAPGMIATVVDEQLNIEASLLVSQVDYTANGETLTTAVKLVRPEAFTINTFPAKDPKAVL